VLTGNVVHEVQLALIDNWLHKEKEKRLCEGISLPVCGSADAVEYFQVGMSPIWAFIQILKLMFRLDSFWVQRVGASSI